MKAKIHAIAGVIGFLTIATFWTSTVISELFGSPATIVDVKNAILWGMAVLIPAMAVAGGSGMSLGQGRTDEIVLGKKKRMPFIAMNGLLVLVPSAVFLANKANANAFDTVFYTVQGVELIAGAINLTLMGLNIRDGLRLTGKLGNPSKAATQDCATVNLREAGPAIVSGLTILVGANGEAVPAKSTMALCRCGASKNKPFCDGSHSAVDFSGEKSPDRTADELISYKGREISVHYNRLLCSKAYECGRRLEAVFDTTREPWIDPDKASAAEVINVIRACPSGALSYSKDGGALTHDVVAGASIETEKDGPYRVRNVEFPNADWGHGACENKYSLCRCGASKNKPFCDGSHVAAGFSDDSKNGSA